MTGGLKVFHNHTSQKRYPRTVSDNTKKKSLTNEAQWKLILHNYDSKYSKNYSTFVKLLTVLSCCTVKRFTSIRTNVILTYIPEMQKQVIWAAVLIFFIRGINQTTFRWTRGTSCISRCPRGSPVPKPIFFGGGSGAPPDWQTKTPDKTVLAPPMGCFGLYHWYRMIQGQVGSRSLSRRRTLNQ